VVLVLVFLVIVSAATTGTGATHHAAHAHAHAAAHAGTHAAHAFGAHTGAWACRTGRATGAEAATRAGSSRIAATSGAHHAAAHHAGRRSRATGTEPATGTAATGAEAPVARVRAGAAGRNDPAVRRPLRAVRHQNVAVGQDRRTRRQTTGKAAGLATGRKRAASARPTGTAGAARHTGATGPTGPVRSADPGRIRRDRPTGVPRRRGGTRVVVTGPAGEAVAGP